MYDEYLERARGKLDAAKYLLQGKFYDDAISRAYYAMYYAARALLSLKEHYPKTHKGVISEFGLEFVKQGFIEETYGRAISYAKDRREEADYGIDLEITTEEAEDIVRSAEKFVGRIEEITKKLEISTKE